MNRLKRLVCIGLSAFIVLTSMKPNLVKAAEYWPDGVDTESASAIVMEEETGTILYSKNIDDIHYPASITKIMTALLVLEYGNLDDIITFSEEAVYKNEGDTSHIARDVGEQMTVEQTLYGMMLESANECAWALAEYVSGDEETFVDLMNEKAKELGCKNTHFNNPNGLPDEEHYTSAYDMALISREAFKIPKFAEIVGTKKYSIPATNKHSDITYLNNHHNMLHTYSTSQYVYDYCLGGKTGYTVDAGSTLVTYAKKDNMTLVCVVMNVKAPGQYLDTRNLFDYCFDNFTVYTVADHTSISDTDINTVGMLSEGIDLINIDPEGVIVLPKTASFLDAQIEINSVNIPEDETIVGQMVFSYADREVGSANLIFSKNEVQSYPFDNIPVEQGGSGKDYYVIDILKILTIAIIVIVAFAIVIAIWKKGNDIRLARHRFQKRHPKKPKTDFRTIDRTYRKRRRRR